MDDASKKCGVKKRLDPGVFCRATGTFSRSRPLPHISSGSHLSPRKVAPPADERFHTSLAFSLGHGALLIHYVEDWHLSLPQRPVRPAHRPRSPHTPPMAAITEIPMVIEPAMDVDMPVASGSGLSAFQRPNLFHAASFSRQFLGSPISWRAGSFGSRFYPAGSPGQLLAPFE